MGKSMGLFFHLIFVTLLQTDRYFQNDLLRISSQE